MLRKTLLVLLSAALHGLAQGALALDSPDQKLQCEQKLRDISLIAPALELAPMPPQEIKTLRLASYNLENFFFYLGKYERTGPNQLNPVPQGRRDVRPKGRRDQEGREVKSERDRLAIQRMIEDQIHPDIMAVQEIEGEEAIDHFAHSYLGDVYQGVSRKGNDTRGIQIGSFERRGLPFEVELRQHTEVTWRDPADLKLVQKLFSRDALVSIYRIKNHASPVLVTINGHFKSKRDRPGDPESQRLRSAQFKEVAWIIQKLQMEFGHGVPIALMGDMNTDVNSAPELAPIRELGFRDVLDLMGIPLDERVTHTYHPNDGPTHKTQMDGIFLSPSLHPHLVRAQVHPYLDESGREMPVPNTYRERSRQPSDHRPISAEIDFSTIIADILGGGST